MVHQREKRSYYTAIIHFVVRRMRNHLGRPKSEQPQGCSKLTPHKIVRRTCEVSERQVDGVYLYDLFPNHTKNRDSLTKHVYYFCGGGWQSPPSGQHWQLCARFAHQMKDTSVTIVSYPLAPNNAAPETIPILLKLYRSLLRQAEEAGHKVILAGDSSGGNVALCLVLEALREDAERLGYDKVSIMDTSHPAAIMAICPSTDLTRSNPDIERLKDDDPLLTPEFIKQTAAAWKGDWDATDRRISPINADISLLAMRGISVHGVTSGHDILRPDAIMFRERLEDAGVKGEWLDWDKQMHCFVLTWPYGVPEGREGTGWIIDMMRKM
ncbi:alpha/beta hydrolase fold-domain-containing protein [Lophiotrema nucula]|uniref:Alpha/beta hydrolase fold-domain-containing protein n=1 Tax=Lophiotrema nucula TaxID=690887 RepID=A0A6A5Z335_9PLEO|nr:alpha/beta hydrolase fold-domain-containing protein [Lophiotrema nucula]